MPPPPSVWKPSCPAVVVVNRFFGTSKQMNSKGRNKKSVRNCDDSIVGIGTVAVGVRTTFLEREFD